jgi:hypothetical protein
LIPIFFHFYTGHIKNQFILKRLRKHVGPGGVLKTVFFDFFNNFKYVKIEFQK